MKDICCIGHITNDRIITKCPPKTIHCAGGTAYYVAWAFEKLNAGPTFQLITSVSNEMMTEVERLRQAGIDIKAFESKTNVFFENSYEEDMNNCTQRVLAKSEPFSIDEVFDAEAKVFHLGSLLADDFSQEVVEFLASKGDVCIDTQGYLRYVDGEKVCPSEWPDKHRILKNTAILKMNEFEYRSLSGYDEPHTAAEQIHDWGVREVIITLGDKGSIIYAGGRFYEIPAYPPKAVVDVTGCGDTYSAGFLFCRAKDMDYADSGRFAAAMCTLKLEHTGPFCHTIDDVWNIIRNHA